MRRGVYVDAVTAAAAADDPERRHALEIAALQLALRCDAVAGGDSAARILGLESLDPMSADLVVVTSDETATGQRRRGYRLRIAELPKDHRASRHGVAITSAARTVVDLARVRRLADGVVIADSALRKGHVSLAGLGAVLDDCRGWPGIDEARRVIELADPGSESVLESMSRVAMHEQGLPAPRTQVVVSDADGPFARVDFLWEQFGVIGEADGLAKYEPDGWRSTREIVRAEKRREERLFDAGFEVVRWTWAEARNPQRLARRLRAAFTRGLERRRGQRTG